MILTNSMHLMGGAELYAIRRAKYLKKKYDCEIVFVLKDVKDEVGFWSKEMEAYKIIHLPEMNKPILYFSQQKLAEILGRIVNKINLRDRSCYIETHTIEYAGWGEMLAQKVDGFNVLYFLNPAPIEGRARFYPYVDFYQHKLESSEMIGMHKSFLSVIFNNVVEKKHNQYVNIGFSPEELSLKSGFNKACNLGELSNYDCIIGTVARLEKHYVQNLLDEIIKFSRDNETKRIALLVGGDTPDLELRKKYNEVYFSNKEAGFIPDNLSIIHLGYINPLGKDFFEKIDVFVGQGTAAINAISQRVATIIMMDSKMTDGVFGIDTDLSGDSDQTVFFDLQDKLRKLLYDAEYLSFASQRGYELFIREYEQKICFEKFDSYLSRLKKPSNYKLSYKLFDRIVDVSLFKVKKIYLWIKSRIMKK